MQGVFARSEVRKQMRLEGMTHPVPHGVDPYEPLDELGDMKYHPAVHSRGGADTSVLHLGAADDEGGDSLDSEEVRGWMDGVWTNRGDQNIWDQVHEEQKNRVRRMFDLPVPDDANNRYPFVNGNLDPPGAFEKLRSIFEHSGWGRVQHSINGDLHVQFDSAECILHCGTRSVTGQMVCALLQWPNIHAINHITAAQLLDLVHINALNVPFRGYLETNKDQIRRIQSESIYHYEGVLFKLLLQTVMSTAIGEKIIQNGAHHGGNKFGKMMDEVWNFIIKERKVDPTKKPFNENDEKSKNDKVEYVLLHGKDEYNTIIQNILRPHDDDSGEFILKIASEDASMHNERKAQQLDHYYAQLVKGSMVNVPMTVVWVPSDEMQNSAMDDANFNKMMWKSLLGLVETWRSRGWKAPTRRNQNWFDWASNPPEKPPNRDNLTVELEEVNFVKWVKELKRAMGDVWTETRQYRVSSEVHMSEVYVLNRLMRDGVFPWIQV